MSSAAIPLALTAWFGGAFYYGLNHGDKIVDYWEKGIDCITQKLPEGNCQKIASVALRALSSGTIALTADIIAERLIAKEIFIPDYFGYFAFIAPIYMCLSAIVSTGDVLDPQQRLGFLVAPFFEKSTNYRTWEMKRIQANIFLVGLFGNFLFNPLLKLPLLSFGPYLATKCWASSAITSLLAALYVQFPTKN